MDVAPDSLIMEVTGDETKIDGLIEVLRPYGVLEMVRTGVVAMRRRNKPAPATFPTKTLGSLATDRDDDVSQSV